MRPKQSKYEKFISSGQKNPEAFIEALVLKVALELRAGFVMIEIKKQKHKIGSKALENEWT